MNTRHLSSLALIAILLLAAFLRLWNLDATEFKYDEATVCNLAAQFVDTGLPPVRGMGSSVGIDNPPLTIWLMSLPVLLSRDPLIASGFVALLNVIAVWGCYALGKRYWSEGVGLLAALLLAIGPWAVFYSRKVWAQNVLLPFVLLFFYLLLAWLIDKRKWALTGAFVTLTATTQIHFATLAFAPLLALVIAVQVVRSIQQKTLPTLWKPLALGVGFSFLLYAPYLVFDAAIGWKNARAFINLIGQPAQLHLETLNYALLNIGGREIHALAGAEKFQLFLNGIANLNYWPDRIVEALFVPGCAYLLVRWWRERHDRRAFARDGVLLLWLLAPVLFYLRSKSAVFPHYLIPLYPAPYLVLGILAMDFVETSRRLASTGRIIIRGTGAAGLLALILWQGYLSVSIHAFVETHDTPGGMGTPIRIYRQVVDKVKQYTAEWDNRQIVVLCPGDEPRYHECPAVWQFLLGRRLDVRFADYNQTLVFPHTAADTLILLAPGESVAAQQISQYAQELEGTNISLRENTNSFHFYRVPATLELAPSTAFSSIDAHFENGATLLGYDLLDPLEAGQTVRLALYWRVDHVPPNPPAQGYSLTVNLIGADGTRYAQKDGPGQRVGLWRTGDMLISWFDLALSAEARPPYTLHIGAYVYTPPSQFDTIQVIDAAGKPIADAIVWPIRKPDAEESGF
ncbi:MAG: glycosyltransferase family 39 protein [Anaerolineae bacterium]|nr:glycosyltransferase family 39 protein [Anaerolineae bacterium]